MGISISGVQRLRPIRGTGIPCASSMEGIKKTGHQYVGQSRVVMLSGCKLCLIITKRCERYEGCSCVYILVKTIYLDKAVNI